MYSNNEKMSFEINGNSASIPKRRSRDKPNTQKSQKNGFQTPNYTLTPPLNAFPSGNIPEHAPYYFPVTYQHHMTTTEPMSLPIYPLGCPTIPYSTHPNHHPRGGYVNNATKYPFQNNEEYASLPIGNFAQNDAALDKRRFSDPGGLPFDSDSSTNSLDDRVVHKLTQQVHALKENNRKLNRELVEMRIELNVLKQQQQQSARHFDRDYEPGMLAEIVKEIRDAARVREDALLAKVKHMIEERQFNMDEPMTEIDAHDTLIGGQPRIFFNGTKSPAQTKLFSRQLSRGSMSLLDPNGPSVTSFLDLTQQDFDVNAPVNHLLLQGEDLLTALDINGTL